MRRRVPEIFLGLGFAGIMTTLYLGLNWAPSVSIDAFESPAAQRIFYWHVPSAWAAFIALESYFSVPHYGFSNEVPLVGGYMWLEQRLGLLAA